MEETPIIQNLSDWVGKDITYLVKETIKNTANDQELGAKIRKLFANASL